jgi:hypothetical protein
LGAGADRRVGAAVRLLWVRPLSSMEWLAHRCG